MSTGEIDCSEADIRILSTVFDQSIMEELLSTPTNINGLDAEVDSVQENDAIDMLKGSEWYDHEDYVDLNQVSLNSSLPLKLEAIPFLYSPCLLYTSRCV